MPVAKFSEEFYEKFGHGLADELVGHLNQIDLTFRSELRELNELNFARFDAKLEQRIAEMKVQLHVLESSLVKWMLAFWAGSTVTVLGTMVALLKL